MANLSIHKRYILNYARDIVFDAWVSSEAVIAPVTAIEVDPRVGGIYKLTVDGERPSHMVGKYLEFDRPSKLVYTWEWNKDGEVSQITVQFKEHEDGTELIIDHSDFAKESSRNSHDTGWDSYVSGLTQWLEAQN